LANIMMRRKAHGTLKGAGLWDNKIMVMEACEIARNREIIVANIIIVVEAYGTLKGAWLLCRRIIVVDACEAFKGE